MASSSSPSSFFPSAFSARRGLPLPRFAAGSPSGAGSAAFAARSAPSGGSLADFEEYREVAAARFKAETLQAKERAMESLHAEQRRAQMREARIAQQRRLQVQNQGYSQRIVDARNSMNRVRIIGAARKSR